MRTFPIFFPYESTIYVHTTLPTILHDGEFSSRKKREGRPTLASCMPNEELKCKWCGVKEQPTLENYTILLSATNYI